ncbi:hypothetical protein J6590_098643, partial [Homalodisca vitripennis]
SLELFFSGWHRAGLEAPIDGFSSQLRFSGFLLASSKDCQGLCVIRKFLLIL